MPEMSLAALRQDDSYDPFAAEKFVNPAVDAMGRGIAQQVATPGRLMAPNPWPEGSEQWHWYEDSKRNAAAKWAPEMAINMIGSPAAVGGLPGTVGSGIKAYHGSPHDFDRFDLSKIGTGEGAQAYGHGLYFADSEAVAKSYRDALTGSSNSLAKHAVQQAGDIDKAILDTQQRLKDYTAMIGGDPERFPPDRVNSLINLQNEKLKSLAAQKAGLPPPAGHMYEVNINADPAHFLDWDKPLREQSQIMSKLPEDVRQQVQSVGKKNKEGWGDLGTGDPDEYTTGQHLLTSLSAKKNAGYTEYDYPAASNVLREAGIPGIKYLDQGSRSKAYTVQPTYKGEPYGDPVHFDHTHPAERWAQEQRDKGFGAEVKDTGSRNYVVFNDKLIDIMRKYGLAGLAPLAGYGAMAGQDQQQ